MYKVFVNERLLILTTKKPKQTKHPIYELSRKSILKAIELLASHKIKKAYVYAEDSGLLFKKLTKAAPLVKAAGGKVVNGSGEVLFIYRNDKWDLPKGKLDKGESIEAAALREVEEETGVNGLQIERFLATTHHIFKRNGIYKLKETHWFEMSTCYSGKLIAQTEEDITKVKWKNPSKTKKALKNSYANIQLLFSAD